MAEKKKMSVADILAAARKTDNKSGAAPEAKPVAAPAEKAVTVESAVGNDNGSETVEPSAPVEKPKPVAGGARPNVKDILAMARAGGKGAAPAAKAPTEKPAPKAAAKPVVDKAAAKPGAAKPAAAKPAAAAKDTASILLAARKGAKPGPITKAEAATQVKAAPKAPAKEKATAPPMPVKPAYAKPAPQSKGNEEGRRGFFGLLFGSALAVGMTALALTNGLWALATARFMFPNILTEPPSRFKVGFKDNFAPGQVETKFVATNGVWVVNGEYNGQQQIYALRTVCTHLGCTPNWLEGEQKFKCPCHGSGFYKDGINFEGPAPRPLERYSIHIGDDGQLEIDKSKTFQEELGQWTDPASFVPV
ncbi:MAG: Rieske 2Fe-2S domain-containing protein [Pirellulales bacterium]|nr:Rieske 2Fe-2S domain-containing protein [Pirellulales bacterium]